MHSEQDLILAFRQAKATVAAERTFSNALGFAEFEVELAKNLNELSAKLRGSKWFSNIDIGRPVFIARDVKPGEATPEVHIGTRTSRRVSLKLRAILDAKPEFSIVEILYLWKFGHNLESLLKNECVAYRTVAQHQLRLARTPYRYWQKSYTSYKNDPIHYARLHLQANRDTTIVSTDITSFFDNINPEFLLKTKFVDEVAQAAKTRGLAFDESDYRTATQSLLVSYSSYGAQLRDLLGLQTRHPALGLPIGSLTSRLIGNLSIRDVDRVIQGDKRTVCYRRYVDDIVAVFDGDRSNETQQGILLSMFPGAKTRKRGQMSFESAGGRLFVNQDKTRTHYLGGSAALNFLDVVQNSFSAATSERRAFAGNLERLAGEFESLVELWDKEGIPRLRDADRFSLRRAVAGTYISSLRRYVRLLDRKESSELLSGQVERIVSALKSSPPLLDFDFALDLLQLTRLLELERPDLDSYIAEAMDEKALYTRLTSAEWNGHVLPVQTAAMVVTKHMHGRYEAALPRSSPANASSESRRLFVTGMRFLDFPDDNEWDSANNPTELREIGDYELVAARLRTDPAIAVILDRIDQFLERARATTSPRWNGTCAAQLFLAPNPPSFAEVAQVLAIDDLAGNAGDSNTTAILDALRSTAFRSRPHASYDATTSMLSLGGPSSDFVRMVVANLTTTTEMYNASVNGAPLLTSERFKSLDHVLRQAERTSRLEPRPPTILVLPELSIPQSWTTDLAEFSFRSKIAVVAGVEYAPINGSQLANRAVGVFPTDRHFGPVVRWTKRHPAHSELELKDRFYRPTHRPRIIVDGSYGRISVAICSELLEADLLAELSGNIETLIVPAWNRDVPSFEHAVHAASSLLVHSFVCISNNSSYSDSRIVAPVREPKHLRDMARLLQRNDDQVVWADVQVGALLKFHRTRDQPRSASSTSEADSVAISKWFPLPPK